jgi:hypothetical protein
VPSPAALMQTPEIVGMSHSTSMRKGGCSRGLSRLPEVMSTILKVEMASALEAGNREVFAISARISARSTGVNNFK